MIPNNVFWFRRDLRLDDNAGLFQALSAGRPVIPVFIFDKTILDKLENPDDARVTFIHLQLLKLDQELKKLGSGLQVYYGEPEKIWAELIHQFKVDTIYCNRDYEPAALARDAAIKFQLAKSGIAFQTVKDQVIFDPEEILKDDGTPYTVFTPYSKKWKALLYANQNGTSMVPNRIKALDKWNCIPHYQNLVKGFRFEPIPGLKDIGFIKSMLEFPEAEPKSELLKNYSQQRDYPFMNGTSRLGIHLRFGKLSIRELLQFSLPLSESFLNELIWREFYKQILFHFPHVAGKSFRPAYDRIVWRNDPDEFHRWCLGKTGYPLVDAGMRELKETGFMHNRVRMVCASFLCKHLLIDWRWGESWFASLLLDFDLSSNNGGWQWAAGSGTDAAPYFRIFNPQLQAKKFDPREEYIRKWIPELGTPDYPKPMVIHTEARERCIRVYRQALNPVF